MPPVVRARGVGDVVTFRVSDPRARRGRVGDAFLAHAHASAGGYMQSDYTRLHPYTRRLDLAYGTARCSPRGYQARWGSRWHKLTI